jgi:divalent metal cation (Fe/Co/Zn/Cd) transporter
MARAAAIKPLKIAAGLLWGSAGVLSDAARSVLDLAARTLTFFWVRFGAKPADESHT